MAEGHRAKLNPSSLPPPLCLAAMTHEPEPLSLLPGVSMSKRYILLRKFIVSSTHKAVNRNNPTSRYKIGVTYTFPICKLKQKPKRKALRNTVMFPE